MVATFFLQRTTAFILFLIVPSLQISCFRKTKEKQYAKYDLNKRIAARLIWQLVIHSCVIFAYIISRRDGENNGFLAGVFLPPSSRAPRVSLAPKTPFPFPFKFLPRRLSITQWSIFMVSTGLFQVFRWAENGASGEQREKKTSGRESKKKTICQLLHNGVRIFTLSEFSLLSSLTRS